MNEVGGLIELITGVKTYNQLLRNLKNETHSSMEEAAINNSSTRHFISFPFHEVC